LRKKIILLIIVLIISGCVKIDETNILRKLVLYSILNNKNPYHTIIIDSIYSLEDSIVIDEGNEYPFDSVDQNRHYVNSVPFYPEPSKEYSIYLKYKDFYEINTITKCPEPVIFNKTEYYADTINSDTIYWNYNPNYLYQVIVYWDTLYGCTDFHEYSTDTAYLTSSLREYLSSSPDTSDTSAYKIVKFYIYCYDLNYKDWYINLYKYGMFNSIEDTLSYFGYFASIAVESVDVFIQR
jgi:hypothetical protein